MSAPYHTTCTECAHWYAWYGEPLDCEGCEQNEDAGERKVEQSEEDGDG